MPFNHTLNINTILCIVEKSYELLPNIKNRAFLIAQKLNIPIPEAEYYINVYESNQSEH